MKTKTKLYASVAALAIALIGALTYLDYAGFLIILALGIITALYYKDER